MSGAQLKIHMSRCHPEESAAGTVKGPLSEEAKTDSGGNVATAKDPPSEHDKNLDVRYIFDSMHISQTLFAHTLACFMC